MFVTFTQGQGNKPLAVNPSMVTMLAPGFDGGTTLSVVDHEYTIVVREPFEQALAMLDGASSRRG